MLLVHVPTTTTDRLRMHACMPSGSKIRIRGRVGTDTHKRERWVGLGWVWLVLLLFFLRGMWGGGEAMYIYTSRETTELSPPAKSFSWFFLLAWDSSAPSPPVGKGFPGRRKEGKGVAKTWGG